ncbi:retrovirus-related pol polyprotein from transposon TNT 1-94 [Tanacetum coccineum]|uniref:Retrovirus-related pol polyprotein from transposon TNT 1-94 n=1 Tax=Tanacetum coccineum TaxID=301880 RepID=A0ABQ5J3G1_9ASTR
MILESVENGPLIWPTMEENEVIRTKKYVELSAVEKIQADYDMKATNIILQDPPADIYSLLYDAFDKFTYIKGETLHNLPLEWGKFVTDVKLLKDLHTKNFDQLHAYLEQHELHVNEVRIMREHNQDPLAFVANQQMTPPHFNTYQSSYKNPQLQQQFSPSQYVSNETLYVLQIAYQSSQVLTQPMTESPLVDSNFAVPVFSPGDDSIACLNKAMAFLTVVASSRYKSNATSSRGNNARGQARVVKCYDCQCEGHMARQCTQPKQTRNATWYKEKAMLAEAQEAGKILDEEQLAFLADPRVPDGQAVQTIIPNTAAF